MADTPQYSPPAATIVKAPANIVTYQRAAAVAGTTAIGPQIVQPIVEWGAQVMHAVWPAIPEPSANAIWSVANIICAAAAGILAWRMRGNTVLPPA